MNRLFIIIGAVFILIGIASTFLGKLPGDFMFKKGNTTIYFPMMTSVIISIVLSLIFMLFNRMK